VKPPRFSLNRIRIPTELPESPAIVFSYVMDWQRQSEWILFTAVSTRNSTSKVGEVVRAKSGIGPFVFTDTMTVTEWVAGERCVIRHKGGIVRGIGIFEVQAQAGGSIFIWTESPGPQPIWYLALWYISYPLNWLFLHMSTRKLKRNFAR
jgi:hypothetical protein